MRVRIQAPPPWKDCEYGEYEKEAMTLRHAFVEKGEPGVLLLRYAWDEREAKGRAYDAGGNGYERHFVVHFGNRCFAEGKLGEDFIPKRRFHCLQISQLAFWQDGEEMPSLPIATVFVHDALFTAAKKPRAYADLDHLRRLAIA